jgi:hypothetical protein
MILTVDEFRDYILRIHELAAGHWLQSDTELKRRIARHTEAAISRDDVLRGFLGRGGPCADRDILGGTASLGDPIDPQ